MGEFALGHTLKRGSIYRVPLSADGQTVSGPIERYFQSENRLRDMTLSPDMRTMYVATDASGLVGTMDGGAGTTLQNPGAILVYTYTGEGDGNVAATTDQPATEQADAAAVTDGIAPTFTAEQAPRGKTAYDANCVSCHGPDLISANYGPPLAGPYFEGKWPGQTVGALYTHTHDRMPPSRPASLGDETYVDLVAYMLQVNGVAPGDVELPADRDALNQMVIPN